MMFRRRPVLIALAACAVLAASCSSSTKTVSPTTLAPTASPTSSRGSGSVDVLYAASLLNLMEKQLGPAFNTATGYNLVGFSGASGALANQIKGKVRQGDVFISASPTVNATLEGPANGDWLTWYASFASSPLVIGYNPHSKFAADLTSKPWYDVIDEPGFLIGRTDPATDPKGKLTATALKDAASANNAPGLTAIAAATGNVYPEETLVGRLQAGQLDAGFFYSSEAKAAGILTVPLTGEKLKATYTITILNHAPHVAAAQALVAFLVGAQGQAILTQDGFTLIVPPEVQGSGAPAGL